MLVAVKLVAVLVLVLVAVVEDLRIWFWSYFGGKCFSGGLIHKSGWGGMLCLIRVSFCLLQLLLKLFGTRCHHNRRKDLVPWFSNLWKTILLYMPTAKTLRYTLLTFDTCGPAVYYVSPYHPDGAWQCWVWTAWAQKTAMMSKLLRRVARKVYRPFSWCHNDVLSYWWRG